MLLGSYHLIHFRNLLMEQARIEHAPNGSLLTYDKVSFKKILEPSHGVLQLLKKNVYSVLLLHLLKSLFSVFHGLQALSIICLR